MIIISNLLLAIAAMLNFVLNFFIILIVARAIVSWVNADPYNPIVRFIIAATEPLLVLVRNRIKLVFGGMDFSPVVIFMAIIFLQVFLVKTIQEYAYVLKSGL